MATKIHLHHVGEVVLAELLKALVERRELDTVPCVHHHACTLGRVVHEAGLAAPFTFEANVGLGPVTLAGSQLLFDGAHEVDVLCQGTDGRGLALEAKLGTDRMAAAEFKKRFLAPVAVTSHKPNGRVKGSMVAILNHRFIEALGALPIRTQRAPAAELVESWALVIREEVWRGWAKRGMPSFAATCHIMVFEHIVAKYGNAAAFDDLVRQAVGDDFFAAWKLGPRSR